MKLDKKYFDDKCLLLWAESGNMIPILRQIARDAADEQRKKCFELCHFRRECIECESKLEVPNE